MISFKRALTNVIGQYWRIEESHYEENGNPKNHIYEDLKVLKKHLEMIENGKN